VQLAVHVVGRRFPAGTTVGFRLRGQHVVLEQAPEGEVTRQATFWDDRDPPLELRLSHEVLQALGVRDSWFGMLFDTGERLELLPIRVEEHGPDVLGPRLIDELEVPKNEGCPTTIVRHVVKGYSYGEWTPERHRELEDMLCSEPFRADPIELLADGDDWVGWKVRNEILRVPGPDDAKLRGRFVGEVFEGQGENGSWEDSPLKTAYGILRALSVNVPPEDPGVQRAAGWLLDWPQPIGRPGVWMLSERHLQEWNDGKEGEVGKGPESFTIGTSDEEAAVVREAGLQQVVPSCARNYSGLCDAMLHVSATAADALCRCGHTDHPRLKDYVNSMLQLGGMFGYFCACWGILDFDREIEERQGREPDFNRRTEEYEIALKSIPYGYGRDSDDLHFLAWCPQCPGVHRPDLADTNGWSPYEWQDIGATDHFALVGSYWQNADCWAKTNRALAQFPACRGSITEFFALFQCHLYQTPLGEWDEGFPAGIFRWIAEVTRVARSEHAIDEAPLLRFARLMLLKTVPWLREHQGEDGLWDHHELPRWGGGERWPPPSPRLCTYHIVSVLDEFGLLAKLRPTA
jgi:hypothetical protein